jgi:DNA-binding transcriptional MerR regulator
LFYTLGATMATLGEACRRSGLSEFQVRWYEKLGLIGGVERSGGRQRRYSDEQVARLEQIARWRQQRLSIRDIKAVLGDGEPPAARVVALVDELQRRVEGLRTLAGATTSPVSGAAAVGRGSQRRGGAQTDQASRATERAARAR